MSRIPVPPHIIRPEEVDGWLADSVNKAVTYHRTSHEAARSIKERGVDLSHVWIGSYGHGFYTATEAEVFHGEAEVAVAVRLTRPLQGDPESVGRVVDDVIVLVSGGKSRLTPPVAAAVRRELLRMGHDGIIVTDGGGDGIDYVIALDAGTVKVVSQ